MERQLKLSLVMIHFLLYLNVSPILFKNFPQNVSNSNERLCNSSLYECSYLSTACRMCAIQVFRSSLEVVWISYISGSLEEAQIRNMAFSSWATSLTISFWREITDGLLSWGENNERGWRRRRKETRAFQFLVPEVVIAFSGLGNCSFFPIMILASNNYENKITEIKRLLCCILFCNNALILTCLINSTHLFSSQQGAQCCQLGNFLSRSSNFKDTLSEFISKNQLAHFSLDHQGKSEK